MRILLLAFDICRVTTTSVNWKKKIFKMFDLYRMMLRFNIKECLQKERLKCACEVRVVFQSFISLRQLWMKDDTSTLNHACDVYVWENLFWQRTIKQVYFRIDILINSFLALPDVIEYTKSKFLDPLSQSLF